MKTTAEFQAVVTGIGSLPHHNVDAALDFSFRHTLPFLPQIPIRNPWEYMIPQALEGLPGLQVEKDGSPILRLSVWEGLNSEFDARLKTAFQHSSSAEAFSSFEPSGASSSSWQPFLWELEERKTQQAKIQIAGPITSQLALRTSDSSPITKNSQLSAQIFKLVLARALGMVRRLKKSGVEPVLFFDEPALYSLSLNNPAQQMLVHELRLVVQTLKKENVLVGLHCCADPDWRVLFNLGFDILSFDVGLSFKSLLKHKAEVLEFTKRGGIFSFGLIPSTLVAGHEINLETGLRELVQESKSILGIDIFKNSLISASCGLAFSTPDLAELVLTKCLKARELLQRS